MKERSYMDDLQIDKFALELEWEKQPAVYMYWAEKLAEAQEIKEKTVRKLSIIKAEMDAKVRTDPNSFNIEKATETAIGNVVINSKEYREADECVIAANKNVNILSSAVEAMDQKKRALTNLTSLTLGAYYSSSGVPSEMKNVVDKNKSNKLSDKLNDNSRLKRRD